MTIDFFFDFESRSHVDLTEVGSVNYCTHPTTEATVLTWAFGRTSPVRHWVRGQHIPDELRHVALNPEQYHFIAHKVLFDYLMWTQVYTKLIPNLKPPKVENISDNMALTSHFRVGAKLDAAANMLKLGYSKDAKGRVLMLKQCKLNSKGVFNELTPDEMKQFVFYGVTDTKLLRDIYYRIPPLTAAERFAWEWTFKRNLKGIKLDMDLVHELNSIVDEVTPGYVKEFFMITGGVRINSPVKCREFFQNYYPEIKDMRADTLRDLLLDTRPVPLNIRRALEIKDLAGSTSIAKLKTAEAQNYNGRIYDILAYAHAQTRRWAGRGIQVQNLPRVDRTRPDTIDFRVDCIDLVNHVREKRPHLKDPIGFVKNLLRRIFIPDIGKRFYCGDWSKIEPTVLFWITGQGIIANNWYEDMAATIYGVPISTIGKDSIERQLGKSAALGCGYNMGFVKFKDDVLKKTGLIISESLSRQAVNAYRKKHPNVTQFWKDLQAAFQSAIHGATVSLCNGKVFVMPMQGNYKGVQIRLPSGSYLYYHDACLTPPYSEMEDQPDGTSKRVYYPSGIGYRSDEGYIKRIYGGLLCENVVSATARDIILPSLWRLEQAGFEVLNTVHDELWGQGEFGRDEEYEKIMCVNPAWCPDMKITAGMENGLRYLK